MSIFKFFIICPPGFEEVAEQELNLKAPKESISSCTKIKGGLLVETELEQGFALNQILKVPSRIILRLHESKVRDLPKLFKKIHQISWRDYLWDANSAIEVTCKKSRLLNSTKIETCVKDALAKYFTDNPTKKKVLEQRLKVKSPTLFLRFEDDLMTLSIDTSGELLHKRYGEKEIGDAPLRENLAAALLMTLKEFSSSDLLIDPMCGSGTFIKEASLFNNPNNREFSYEFFPFRKKLTALSKPLEISTPGLFETYKGFDVDQAMVQISQRNCEHLKDCFEEKDIFAPVKIKLSGSLIINPPYNKRMKTPDRNFYNKLQKSLERNYNIDVLGLIIPRDYIETISQKFLVKKISFRNGGFPLYYLVFKYKKLPGG